MPPFLSSLLQAIDRTKQRDNNNAKRALFIMGKESARSMAPTSRSGMSSCDVAPFKPGSRTADLVSAMKTRDGSVPDDESGGDGRPRRPKYTLKTAEIDVSRDRRSTVA